MEITIQLALLAQANSITHSVETNSTENTEYGNAGTRNSHPATPHNCCECFGIYSFWTYLYLVYTAIYFAMHCCKLVAFLVWLVFVGILGIQKGMWCGM